MNRIKGIVYVVLSAVAFGLMPILAKIAYDYGSNSSSVLFFRFIFAAIMVYIYMKVKKIDMHLKMKQFIFMLILGIVGYAGCSITLFTSYYFISVGLASMILYIHPAIVVVLSALIYKEKISCKKILSLIITLIGLYILIGIKDASLNFTGVFLALASAICYSIYVVGISSKEFKRINTYVMTFYFSLISAGAMFILGVITNTLNIKLNIVSFTCILILAFISTIIALITFIEGVKIIGPSNATILSTLEPIVSIILGVLILKEVLTRNIVIGSIFIILAIMILIREK